MVRRIASQVHKQASRLLRNGYIKTSPRWHEAALDHPPLPLPARSPVPRTPYDAPTDQRTLAKSTVEIRPLPIVYLEDKVRKQFFRDHPFETYRPVSLAEEDRIEGEHPVRGVQWTRLRQRGRNPSPEEAVLFAVNLHQHHNVTLAEAYATAVAQFRALRSEQHIANLVAAQEAEAYGAVFGPSAIESGFAMESKVLTENQMKSEQIDQRELVARKRWRLIAQRSGPQGEWSKGQEYVRLWKEGVRPDYTHITQPLSTEITLEQRLQAVDDMAGAKKSPF
ncbi:mitochondrial ribosomal protein S25-domain-containing protein [Amylostereum chailletii]|nr:mitochondrial ribosomal protein S25-domain-containing protein [Amylostereum chailletii]